MFNNIGGSPWSWCWRRRGRGRPPRPRILWSNYNEIIFMPMDSTGHPLTNDPIYVFPDELEALKLVYVERLGQREAAEKMGISQGTLWRSLDNGRRKIVQALIERRPIIITYRKEECIDQR